MQLVVCVYTNTAIASVPSDINASPTADFFFSFSFKKIYEKATVISMLILSIGTTTLTTPF